MKLERTILLLCTVAVSVSTAMAYDHIIFRNGQEGDVKLHQINDENVIFSYIGDRTGVQQEIPSKDVYMVYIEKQGNVYITPDGKRITGESKRVDPKKNDVIYLVKGAELGVADIRIAENGVQYSIKSKKMGGLGGKKTIGEAVLDKSDVFMIRYKSGMIDVITPIERSVEVVDTVLVTEEPEQPEFIVVFHEVRKGDTLDKIADSYGVSVEQLREWNDIPARTKTQTPLKAGMQLMIYQPKTRK